MNKFAYYLFGIFLVIYGLVLSNWFIFGEFSDFSYSLNHITNPMYFARIISPILSIYLGLFFLYCAIKHRINKTSKISFYVLFVGLLLSILLMYGAPLSIGGASPLYAIIMASVGRLLMPLSILISLLFSFISLFKKSKQIEV